MITCSSRVVLAEALLTLRSAYAQGKSAQLQAVRSLLNETAFAFEDRDAIVRAAGLFEQYSCGFSDCLVVSKNASLGGEFVATFDRSMRKLPGARAL